MATSVAGVGVAGVDRKGLTGQKASTGHQKACMGGGDGEVAESSVLMVDGVAVGGGEVAAEAEAGRLILPTPRKECRREISAQQVRIVVVCTPLL